MTRRADLLLRLRELEAVVGVHRRAKQAARDLIHGGDLDGGETAIADLELALHPALAAGGGGAGLTLLSYQGTVEDDGAEIEVFPIPAGTLLLSAAVLMHQGDTGFISSSDPAFAQLILVVADGEGHAVEGQGLDIGTWDVWNDQPTVSNGDIWGEAGELEFASPTPFYNAFRASFAAVTSVLVLSWSNVVSGDYQVHVLTASPTL